MAEGVSVLRRAWDHVPRVFRRPIVWAMRSDRLRLLVLDRLGIRKRTGFFPLSKGGPAVIQTMMERLAREGPAGDYYEFGLYRGYTFWYAQQAAQRAGLREMRFFGFDSFTGLPEVQGDDKRAGVFISGDYSCSRLDVERVLTVNGLDWERSALIEGYFDDSLVPATKVAHDMHAAALVMVDCDLYQSTKPVLSFLADLLQDGTILLFDDWYCFGGADDLGEPRALKEFLQANRHWRADHLMDFPTYGRAFVMRQ